MNLKARFALLPAIVGTLLLAALPALAATAVFTGTLNFAANPYADHPVWIAAGTAVDATLDCDASFALDPLLAVYGPDGSLLDFSDDGADACDGVGSYLEFVAATSGYYTFRASSWDYALVGEDTGSGSGGYTLTVNGAGQPPAGGSYIPPDHRINLDQAAPVVVYCQSYGIDIYARNADNRFLLALQVLRGAYESLGTPTENTLLGSNADGSVRLFLLSTGEFQVNAIRGNEEYVMIWTGCPAGALDISVYDRTTGALLAQGNFPQGMAGAMGTPPAIPPLMPGELGAGAGT